MSEVASSQTQRGKKEMSLWVIGAAIFVIVFGPALVAWGLQAIGG